MARRATSLGPKPSLCIIFLWFFVVLFLSLLSITKKLVFPQKGNSLFLFESLPLFLLSLFWPPPFSIFLSLSLSLVASFVFSFLSFLVAFFWFLVFVSSFPFLSSLLLFHKKGTASKHSITKFFFINIYFLASCLVCFLSNQHPCFGFKTQDEKNTNFWSKGGLQQNGDLLWTCVFGRLIFIHLQCWEALRILTFQHQRCIKILCPKGPEFYTPLALKSQNSQHLPALEVYKNQSPSFAKREKLPFLGLFASLGWCSKNTIGIVLQHIKKTKLTIFKVINWVRSKLLTGPSQGSKKKNQLGPINNFENLRAQFPSFVKNVLKPLFLHCFWQTVLKNKQTWPS